MAVDAAVHAADMRMQPRDISVPAHQPAAASLGAAAQEASRASYQRRAWLERPHRATDPFDAVRASFTVVTGANTCISPGDHEKEPLFYTSRDAVNTSQWWANGQHPSHIRG